MKDNNDWVNELLKTPLYDKGVDAGFVDKVVGRALQEHSRKMRRFSWLYAAAAMATIAVMVGNIWFVNSSGTATQTPTMLEDWTALYQQSGTSSFDMLADLELINSTETK